MKRTFAGLWLAALGAYALPAHAGGKTLSLQFLGRTPAIPAEFNKAAAEIGVYDPCSRRLFVVNGATGGIDIISINNPTAPTRVGTIGLSRMAPRPTA